MRLLIIIAGLFLSICVSASSLNLDYNDIPIRQAIQFIAQSNNMNVIISQNVQGNITLHLNDIAPLDALNVILQETGLGEQRMGNVRLIAPLPELAQHEKMQESLENLAPLQSVLLPLHYSKAQDVANSIRNNNLLSSRGSVSVDTRTNAVWVQDVPIKLSAIQSFIQQIDVPVQQVLIEARIVSVDQKYEQALGVKFGLREPVNNVTGKFNVDLPVGNPNASSLGITLAKLGAGTLLNLELSAIEAEGAGTIISSPRLMTANQQPATILSGQEIPYQHATSSGATSISFQKAVLSLTVTPQITPNGKLVLTLHVNQDHPTTTLVQGVPVIETRQIQTLVTVNNGQTVVLGGIYEQNNEKQVERVPFFGKLPVVGALFRHKMTKKDHRELLIFITPKIATS